MSSEKGGGKIGDDVGGGAPAPELASPFTCQRLSAKPLILSAAADAAAGGAGCSRSSFYSYCGGDKMPAFLASNIALGGSLVEAAAREPPTFLVGSFLLLFLLSLFSNQSGPNRLIDLDDKEEQQQHPKNKQRKKTKNKILTSVPSTPGSVSEAPAPPTASAALAAQGGIASSAGLSSGNWIGYEP